MIFYLYLIAVYIPTNTIAEPVISIKLAPIPNKIHWKKRVKIAAKGVSKTILETGKIWQA